MRKVTRKAHRTHKLSMPKESKPVCHCKDTDLYSGYDNVEVSKKKPRKK